MRYGRGLPLSFSTTEGLFANSSRAADLKQLRHLTGWMLVSRSATLTLLAQQPFVKTRIGICSRPRIMPCFRIYCKLYVSATAPENIYQCFRHAPVRGVFAPPNPYRHISKPPCVVRRSATRISAQWLQIHPDVGRQIMCHVLPCSGQSNNPIFIYVVPLLISFNSS